MIFFKQHIVQAQPYKGGSTREESGVTNDFHKLSSNENPLGPSPLAMQAIRQNLHLLHEYNYQNDERFCEELSHHFEASILPDQFITANSGMELLDLICRAFVEPGDECILSSPTFMAYQNFGLVQGAKIIDVPLQPNDFSLDLEAILNAVTPKTRIIFLTNPNNPTGTYIPKKITDAFIHQLPDSVVVVYDEVYYHFVDAPDFAPAIDYIKQGKNVIGLHSFSKAYGLAGIRLGYAFTTPLLADYLRRLRRPFMINTLTMEAGIAALGDTNHLQKTKALVHAEKKWLYQKLDELGITYWPSEANFIFFRSPFYAKTVAEQMLERGVMVRTGEVFKAPGYIRVTIGTHEANKTFIRAMQKLMEERPVVNAHE